METYSGDCGFILNSSGKTFYFSLLQFLVSEDFVFRLGLLKCFKDFQKFRSLEMILVNRLEPDIFKWRTLLTLMFTSYVSIIKNIDF